MAATSPARRFVVIGAVVLVAVVAFAGLVTRLSPVASTGSPAPSAPAASGDVASSAPASAAFGLPTPGPTPSPVSSVLESAVPLVTPPASSAPVVAPTGTPKPPTTPAPTPKPTPKPTAESSGAWPAIGHIYEIVLENKEAGSIIGNSAAPYINSLAKQYGLATNYTAVSHPSLPNYLALWSGSTQGVHDDDVHNFSSGPTLADQIAASGRSWHVAAENVPLGCFTGGSASGGEDGSGDYARKHEPAISWTSVSSSPSRCNNITDFTHFGAGVGNFWFIAPNLCHDMHDCSVAVGDQWLKGFLPSILGSAAYQSNGLILLTFDEGSSDIGGGGKVATIVISPKAKAAFTSAHSHTHYSLVRTIEALWGMPCMANSCSANTLREFFP
jgi:phosphatidylinositol-3-phosphatase